MAKRRASGDLEAGEPGGDGVAVARINVLGAGQEVGRSCVVISYM
jgi:hypothetical protein